MWRFFVTFTCLYCVSGSVIQDISHQICKDVVIGDVMPNPRDCNSFFICGEVPLMKYCDHGQHFDAKAKVCNWPELANCHIIEMNTRNNEFQQPTANEKRIALAPSSKTPQLFFTAIDVNTNKALDPMTNYDPKNVVCHHYGAYFLPHPTDCSSYYVCAFGHMLQHKCGRGTGWNYKRQLCEIRPITECYSGSYWSMNSTEEEAEAEAETFTDSQSSGKPPMTGVYTVCYILNNGTAGPLTWVPQTAIDNIGETPAEGVQFMHTPPTITAISSTGRVNAGDPDMPSCPKNDEAYLPHSTDCSKYYICIIGMPVLTSCPDGLYWDQTTEFCDSPSNVQCTQKKI